MYSNSKGISIWSMPRESWYILGMLGTDWFQNCFELSHTLRSQGVPLNTVPNIKDDFLLVFLYETNTEYSLEDKALPVKTHNKNFPGEMKKTSHLTTKPKTPATSHRDQF